MAKDAKGHGSEKRGDKMFGRQPTRSDRKQLSQITKAFSAFAGAIHGGDSVSAAHDKAAAAALGEGNPKAGAAPVHSGAAGRTDDLQSRIDKFNSEKDARQGAARNAEQRAFHRERASTGPHYLDPKDPRGSRPKRHK